jgi:hypothetical protein
MKLLLAIASLLLLVSPPLGAAAEAPPPASTVGDPCAHCSGPCLACKECVDTKRGDDCAPCWAPKACLQGETGEHGRGRYGPDDCRACWDADDRCPAVCGKGSICAEKCAGCVGGDGQRKGGAECAACWEPNAALQAEIAAKLGVGATPAAVAALAKTQELEGVQCLGSPHGKDCSYCWKHHAPTRIEL